MRRSEHQFRQAMQQHGLIAAWDFLPAPTDQVTPDLLGRYPLQHGSGLISDSRDPTPGIRGALFGGDDYFAFNSRLTEVFEHNLDFSVMIAVSTASTAAQELFSRSTGVRFFLNNNSASFQVYNGITNNTGLASNLAYSDGNARIYLGVWDGVAKASEIYVDGTLRGRTANAALNSALVQTSNAFIGCLNGNAVFAQNGTTIHSMYLFNRRVLAQQAFYLSRMERQNLSRRGVMAR